MPNINSIKQSKYLKREDVGRGLLLTVKGCTQQNVAPEGQPQELKWCLHFNEHAKPLVLNTTNAQLIAGFLASDETDQWIGKKIVLFDDPTVMNRGQVVGGIRARAPRNTPPAVAAPAAPQAVAPVAPAAAPATAAADDDIPF
jgi:hypothetical protein